MTKRGRWLICTAFGLLTGAWFAAQIVLGRHAFAVMRQHEIVMHARFLRMHPTAPVEPVSLADLHTRYWLLPATASLIALVACYLTVGALVLGGRRRWAAVVTAMPLSLFMGITDANSLGLAWLQPFRHLRSWLAAGAAIDAVMVLAAVGVVSSVATRRTADAPVLPAVLRTLPIAIISFGWWLVGRALPDPFDRVFVTRTLLLVLVSAIVATLRLPLAIRVAVLFVLPFADPNMSDGLIQDYASWGTYFHHVGVAVATVLYVAGLPHLASRLRSIRPATQPV